jgi:hypothetical protein
VQLTNLDGSTLKSPLIVQTSILPVVGLFLPTVRLKQLAQEILNSPERNLGLNHTLFGKVKKIELSSYLEYTLGPTQAPSPSPTPLPTPAPSPLVGWTCGPPKAQVKKNDYGGSPSEAPSYTAHSGGFGGSHNDHRCSHHAWHSGGLAPSVSTSSSSPNSDASPPPRSSNDPHYAPSPAPSMPLELSPTNIRMSPSASPTTMGKSPSAHGKPLSVQSPSNSPYSQPSPSIAPAGGISHHPEGSSQTEGSTFFTAPSQAPEGFAPGPIFGPSLTSSGEFYFSS